MLKIRHFQPSDNEYEEICRVHNAEWADHPTTVDNIKWGDENWNAEYLFQRFVAELDGAIVGMALYYYRYSTWKGKTIHLVEIKIEDDRGRVISLCKLTNYIMPRK